MRNRREWNCRTLIQRRWIIPVLLMAFAIPALVPTGFMPGPGGLILCPHYISIATGSAAHSMPHDMSGMNMAGMSRHGHSSSHGDGGNAPDHGGMALCPFAAAAVAISAPHAVSAVVFAHLIPTSIELPPQEFIPRDTIVPTRLPRGPPSLA
jgi:hypothetical protein